MVSQAMTQVNAYCACPISER